MFSKSISKNFPSKKRSPNWSIKEINMLIEEVEQNVDQVMGPYTATVTSQTRKHAWESITLKGQIHTGYYSWDYLNQRIIHEDKRKFINSINLPGIIRTPAQVEKKWIDLKHSSKKVLAIWNRAKKVGGLSNILPPSRLQWKVISLSRTESLKDSKHLSLANQESKNTTNNFDADENRETAVELPNFEFNSSKYDASCVDLPQPDFDVPVADGQEIPSEKDIYHDSHYSNFSAIKRSVSSSNCSERLQPPIDLKQLFAPSDTIRQNKRKKFYQDANSDDTQIVGIQKDILHTLQEIRDTQNERLKVEKEKLEILRLQIRNSTLPNSSLSAI